MFCCCTIWLGTREFVIRTPRHPDELDRGILPSRSRRHVYSFEYTTMSHRYITKSILISSRIATIATVELLVDTTDILYVGQHFVETNCVTTSACVLVRHHNNDYSTHIADGHISTPLITTIVVHVNTANVCCLTMSCMNLILSRLWCRKICEIWARHGVQSIIGWIIGINVE